jgi:rubrerythrin
MDIFAFAMEKEKYSEHYYRELADKTSHAGLKNILTMLANEEVKHYRTVESMKTKEPQAVGEGPVLANAKETFEKMRGSAEKFRFDVSEADLYRKARDIEEKSKAFYLEKADEVEDPDQKQIFRKLAEEEAKHAYIVQNICDFVSRPETYLEDAEFYHFDDYVGGQF